MVSLRWNMDSELQLEILFKLVVENGCNSPYLHLRVRSLYKVKFCLKVWGCWVLMYYRKKKFMLLKCVKEQGNISSSKIIILPWGKVSMFICALWKTTVYFFCTPILNNTRYPQFMLLQLKQRSNLIFFYMVLVMQSINAKLWSQVQVFVGWIWGVGHELLIAIIPNITDGWEMV